MGFDERRKRIAQQLAAEEAARKQSQEDSTNLHLQQLALEEQTRIQEFTARKAEIESDPRWQEMMRLVHNQELSQALKQFYLCWAPTKKDGWFKNRTISLYPYKKEVIADYQVTDNQPVGSIFVKLSYGNSDSIEGRYGRHDYYHEFCIRFTHRELGETEELTRNAGIAIEIPAERREEHPHSPEQIMSKFSNDHLTNGMVFYDIDSLLEHLALLIEAGRMGPTAAIYPRYD